MIGKIYCGDTGLVVALALGVGVGVGVTTGRDDGVGFDVATGLVVAGKKKLVGKLKLVVLVYLEFLPEEAKATEGMTICPKTKLPTSKD